MNSEAVQHRATQAEKLQLNMVQVVRTVPLFASLRERGVVIRAGSTAGIVEEFPGAYKDVHSVIDVVARAGRRRLRGRRLGGPG